MDYSIVVLLAFILSCAGITQMVCYGTIFDPVRPTHGFLGDLFRCSMCLGFHVGYLVFLIFYESGIVLFPSVIAGCLIFGSVSSLTSYVFDKLIGDAGLNVGSSEKKKNIVNKTING